MNMVDIRAVYLERVKCRMVRFVAVLTDSDVDSSRPAGYFARHSLNQHVVCSTWLQTLFELPFCWLISVPSDGSGRALPPNVYHHLVFVKLTGTPFVSYSFP